MGDADSIQLVADILTRYVSSPSLRHLREPRMLHDTARKIVRDLLHRSTVWRKWEGEREPFLRSVSTCWIPIEDLRAFLNDLPGPALTTTDVVERMRAIHEEPYERYPNEDVRDGCLALYEREKRAGTELPAIAGALRTYIEEEEARLSRERQAAWDAARRAEKAALEQRFLSGADCKWTAVNGSKNLYCRVNGRSYRLSLTSDKRWELHRIGSLEDKGVLIGRYAPRGDMTKALGKIAYQPDFQM